jgi:O-antigen/teichoic acid export membrane protein
MVRTAVAGTLDETALTGGLSGQDAAHALLRRAPMAYVWNQLGSLWLFAASFLLTLTVARGLSNQNYGIFVVALTFYNSAVYLAAFGLEDAATVFVPRTLALQGQSATASVVRRLLFTRALCVALVSIGIAWGLPAVVSILAARHLPGADLLVRLTLPSGVNTLALPVAAYVASTGIMNLLNAILTALLRTRLTLLVGGLAQVANVAGVLVIIRLSSGVGGVLLTLAAIAAVASAIYVIVLAPFISGRGVAMSSRSEPETSSPPAKAPPFQPVLRLGATAWLTNLITGALLKQAAISLLQYYAVGLVAVGYFSLAFQLSHAAAFLLVAGLGGVGLAVMAAAYAGTHLSGLATAWRTVSKVQMLFAVPLLAFCTLRTSQIAVLLYGQRYTAVGPLLGIFLIFTLGQRLTGGGSHQATLYVLGRQRLAFLAQAGALALTVVLGVLLIPRPGPLSGAAGALIAVGIGQVGAEVFQLVLAWRLLNRAYPVRCAVRLCLALLPAMLLVAVWPRQLSSALSWSLVGHTPMAVMALLTPSATLSSLFDLALAGIGFLLVLLICLAITKPLDGEDRALLAGVSPRLARLLAPFAGSESMPSRHQTGSGESGARPGLPDTSV